MDIETKRKLFVKNADPSKALEELCMPGYYFLLLLRLDDFTMNKPTQFDLGFSVAIIHELISTGRVVFEKPGSTKIVIANNFDQFPKYQDPLLNKAVKAFQNSRQLHEIKTWVQRFAVWVPLKNYKLCSKWCRTYGSYFRQLGMLRDVEENTVGSNKYYLANEGLKYHQWKLMHKLLVEGEPSISDLSEKTQQKIVLVSALANYYGLLKRLTTPELDSARLTIQCLMDNPKFILTKALLGALSEIIVTFVAQVSGVRSGIGAAPTGAVQDNANESDSDSEKNEKDK